jgi:hypothetical protein
MDMNANFGNNRNEILEMDDFVLNDLNSSFGYNNAETLRRVQLHNPLYAIYGFRYKGVYNVNFSTFRSLSVEEQEGLLAGTLPDEFYAERGWTKMPMTAPVVLNENGEIVRDGNGYPIRIKYDYRNDGTGHDGTYPGFNGGDAIYEDVNYDGQINALDIVYLGSSLPKLTGGFGFTFNYGDWRLSTQFTYRLGNKILNLARLDSEAMIGNDNQAQAVNYRWRKEGDGAGDNPVIPRAMFGSTSNYNTLISDRFVEKGDYLRLNYAQLSYNIKKKHLTWIGLSGVTLSLSASNLFVLTKYTGVDPEVSYGGYGPATDYGQTPRARSFTMSMNVSF